MKISAGATDSQFILHVAQAEAQQVVANALTKLGGIKSFSLERLRAGENTASIKSLLKFRFSTKAVKL